MRIGTLFANSLLAAVLGAAAPALAASPAPAPVPAQPVRPAGAAAAAPDADYVLGPEDVIEVEVLGRTDFTARVKVNQDGNVLLPYLGSFPAANQTADQLAAKVKQALISRGLFTDPILRLEVVGYASKYVTVLGELPRPGLIPVDRPTRLSELLARVGGVNPNSADYVNVRSENGDTKKYSIKVLATGDLSQDPYIKPGDKIFVPKAELFYISGQVRAPGTYAIETDMNLRTAIARGGGLTDIGSDKGVKVTHADGKADKEKLDTPVQPGDVIVVGEKLF